MADIGMKEALSLTWPADIALAKSLLERDGIPFFAQGEIHSAIEARIPVRFLVPEDRLEDARRTLQGFL